jgi:hypothetical protein
MKFKKKEVTEIFKNNLELNVLIVVKQAGFHLA